MNQLKSLVYGLSGGHCRVFGLMLLSAAVVTIARLFSPIMIGWDLSIQLEAAYRFTQGLGLTNAFSPQFDLSQPPIAEPLTHFPPGLSLLVAAFLSLGFPLAIALKIIYSLTTLIGWLSWAAIACRCLLYPVKLAGKSWPVNLLIAAILPFWFTPPWGMAGTDIFLWAGVPVVTLLLVWSSNRRFWTVATFLAGCAALLLLCFRYASSFLLGAACLIIFCTEFPKRKQIIERCGLFLLPFLVTSLIAALFLPLVTGSGNNIASLVGEVFYNHGAKYVQLEADFTELLVEPTQKILLGFTNLYFLLGIGLGSVGLYLKSHFIFGAAFGILLLLVIGALPFALIKYKISAGLNKGSVSPPDLEIAVALSCLLVGFILYASALAFVVTYTPLKDERYFFPLKFCLVFVAYRMLFLPDFSRLLKALSKTLILIFIGFNILVFPAHQLKASGANFVSLLFLGFTPERAAYPSNAVFTAREATLDILLDLEAQYPNALFFAQDYPNYASYIKFSDPQRLRRIPDRAFWQAAYVSQPVKIFWIISNKRCSSVCPSAGFFNYENSKRSIPALESLPNLEPIPTGSNQQPKIMVSDLPAGYHFVE